MLESRQDKLDNAGIELSDERADTGRADNDPGIIRLANDNIERRRLMAREERRAPSGSSQVARSFDRSWSLDGASAMAAIMISIITP